VVQTSPDVTLEEDLSRRDLTINAIALALTPRALRPFLIPMAARATCAQGAAPRDRRLPRRPGAHPARGALRGALHRLSVAPETMALMREMVAHGEADHPERVWQERAA
jgi:tRNA nucleotidyltransferase (CCA-adding enzyme)